VRQTIQSVETELTLADVPSEDIAEWLDTFRSTLDDVVQNYNMLATLRVGTLGVPSLAVWGGARLSSPSIYEVLWISFLGIADRPDLLISVSDAESVNMPVWQVQHEASWLLLSILLTLIGIGIACIYLTSISRGLGSLEDRWSFWPRVLKLGVRVAVFWVLRAVVLTMVGVPFLLILWVLSMLSPGLALVFGTVALGMGTWLSFYGIFFVAALVVNNSSIWRALWSSFSVVLRNFWSTLWLFLLINLIGGGLTILWQQLTIGSWLTWLGIVGNAYIGTSLVTGSLVFYQDRYSRWQQAVADLLSQKNRRTA